jgi:hypothetical protein
MSLPAPEMVLQPAINSMPASDKCVQFPHDDLLASFRCGHAPLMD